MPEVSELVVPVPTLDQNVADQSETDVIETPADGGTDTTETVAETDEQKNARELAEQRERSEKKSRGVQKRLDELTADKYAERAAREAAERRADQLLYEMQQRQQQPKPQGEGPPRREDFTDYEEFVRKSAVYEARQTVQAEWNERQQQVARQQQEFHAQQAAAALQRDVNSKLSTYAKDHPDIKDVIASHDEQVPMPAAFAVMTHKDTGALMEFMGNNREFVVSLQSMNPVAQQLAIGELAATLRSKPPQVSKAPAPGTTVGPRGSTNKDVRSMSADEYYDHITKGRGKKK